VVPQQPRGGQKEGCFGCGHPDHFVANCPKKNKHSSGKNDAGKHKDKREYNLASTSPREGSTRKRSRRNTSRKPRPRSTPSLSDLDIDSSDEHASSSSSDNESERKVEEKLNGLCFFADPTHGGFCTMALGNKAGSGKGDALNDDDCTSQVSLSDDELATEINTLNAALLSQDKLLKRTAHDRKEYKDKLEVALKELEFAMSAMVVSDEAECDSCAIHISNFATLQTKNASLLDELEEVKARPILLGACKSCLGLQSELAEKVAKISLLEKASSDSTGVAKCALCGLGVRA
jgi:hypothetical protein